MNAPDLFLRRAHRRARGGPLLWAFALVLVAAAVPPAVALGWLPDSAWPRVVQAFAAIAAVVVLIFWIRRARRLDAAAHARELDARLGLAARLEASAELAADPSALAEAQRADAAARLAARPAPPAFAWGSALAALALVALLLLSELSVVALRSFASGPEIVPPAARPPDIAATLTWKSPESEIKATAIEEIPLAALASTKTGLRSLSLEVAVNGEPRLSRPLDAAALAKLAAPGEHRVELELYLDEVGAQEFDLVSYHLRADRATATPAPVVASPLQFVQIRPPRDDVERLRPPPGGGGQSIDMLATLLGNLKAAQLQLLKQNFVLAHAPVEKNSADWIAENTRVAAEQTTLAQKTAEARDFAIAEGLPTLVVDNLGQALPLMETAAKQISSSANEPAAKPQGQALGLIVAAEKLIRKVIIEGGGGPSAGQPPPPKNHDPFKDKQQFKLPPRGDTPAGQLEQLAQGQSAAAAQTPPADGAPKKDPLQEQADLAAKLGALADSKTLDASAQAKAEQAARDAAAAAAQLKAGDADAARAPAAAAAQAAREAAAAQEAAGRATAAAELEKLRREINAAESLAAPDERAAALAAVAEKLRAEALAQQQTGSAEAARQLAAAADKVAQAAARAAAEAKGENPGAGRSPGDTPSPGQGEGQGEGAGENKPGGAPSSAPGQGSPGPQPGASPGSSPSESSASGSPSGAPSPTGPAGASGVSSGQRGSGSGRGAGGSGASAANAARSAAAAQAALMVRDHALARTARQLERAVGDTPPGPAEFTLAVQLAEALLAEPEAADLAGILNDNTRRDQARAGNVVVIPRDARDAVARLVVLLEAARAAGKRDETVRSFNPDDLDPAYRAAIEAYFEKLSRDAAARDR